jgi:hypothetical protein
MQKQNQRHPVNGKAPAAGNQGRHCIQHEQQKLSHPLTAPTQTVFVPFEIFVVEKQTPNTPHSTHRHRPTNVNIAHHFRRD